MGKAEQLLEEVDALDKALGVAFPQGLQSLRESLVARGAHVLSQPGGEFEVDLLGFFLGISRHHSF